MFTIEVYNKNTKSTEFFNRNGDATLEKCMSCIVKERLNGEYELEIVYPLNDRKSHYLKKWSVIKADGQLFRIYSTKNDFINNTINVSARHIFYDLDNYFTEDSRAVECNVRNAMIKALETNGLNSIYKVDSDIEIENTLYFVEQSPLTSMFEIMQRWGVGELIRDNFNITIRNDVTYTEDYEIRYKKNILGLVVEEHIDNIVTKIYPVGYNGITLPEKYVYVPNTNFTSEVLPPYEVVKKVKFENAVDLVNLRIEANRYVEKISQPFTNIKCDMVEIYDTPTYKERFKNIKKIKPGDVCKVVHDEYNFHVFMKCVYVERDLMNAQNNKVELGELKEVLDKSPDFSDIYSKIEQSKPSVYFYQNNETLTLNNVYSQLFYEGISVGSNTHLKLYIALNGVSNVSGNILDIEISINNDKIPFSPKSILHEGENVIGIPIAIPALQGGEAYWISVKAKTLNGNFTIEKNNAQIFAEGVGLDGGTSSERPHIEDTLEIKYSDCKHHDTKGLIVSMETQKPISINKYSEIKLENIKLDTPKEKIAGNVLVTLIKVVDEFHFDKSEEFNFEFNKELVYINGEKGQPENETFISNINEIETPLNKETFGEGFLYSTKMPMYSNYKKIESEVVVNG